MINVLNKENNIKSVAVAAGSTIPLNFDNIDSLKWYVSGLIDAEGSFGVNIIKRDSSKTGYGVLVYF